MSKKENKSLYCKKCQEQTAHKHYSLFPELDEEELKQAFPDIEVNIPDIKFDIPDIKLDFSELDTLLEGWKCTECGEAQGEKPSTPKKRKRGKAV